MDEDNSSDNSGSSSHDIPLKLGVDDVLGVSRLPEDSSEFADGEIKMVEISHEDSAEKLLTPVLNWLQSSGEQKKSAIIYIAPDSSSQGDTAIAETLRRILDGADIRGAQITFIFHSQTGIEGFRLESVMEQAFAGEEGSAYGLPRRRLTPFEARLTWAQTTHRWDPLEKEFVDLGNGLIIPLQRIAAYFVDLLEGSAQPLPVDVKVKSTQEAGKAA